MTDTDDMGPHSPGMIAAGAIFAGLGSIGLGVGAAIYLDGQRQCDDAHNLAASSPQSAWLGAVSCASGGGPLQVIGIATMAGSGSLVVTGVPLIIVGALPHERAPTPEVVLGPAYIGLRGAF